MVNILGILGVVNFNANIHIYCINLHSHLQLIRACFFIHTRLVYVILIIPILTGMTSHLFVFARLMIISFHMLISNLYFFIWESPHHILYPLLKLFYCCWLFEGFTYCVSMLCQVNNWKIFSSIPSAVC